ncbi:hypothetical protein GCM10011316_07540 [Roseibium aquae]|uniref:Signal recognition particle receptor FtsY n=1 Tax=Roseibium aquae TaxID=1323746 RepID=A0A916TAG7_9HYPH|nr:signal recognition particle-docking protein FtsY [Roseibium aquae]GGB37949.1 hypothetical protein GCM10011316_07540 [Roseibium aquae]
MSEKKRGFFGRLFGGKESGPEEEDARADETLTRPDEELQREDKADTLEPRPNGEADPARVADDVAAAEAVGAEVTEPENRRFDNEPADADAAPAPVLQDSAGAETFEPVAEPEDPAPADLAPASIPSPSLSPSPAAAAAEDPVGEKVSWFQKLKRGLSRSSSALTDGITSIFTKRKLDASMLEELEDILIQADLGVDTAMAITDRLSDGRYNKEISPEEVRAVLSEEVEKVLTPVAEPLNLDRGKKPHVVLMVGVNGTGKTTTIGKLSQKLSAEGKTVMLAAGDTFRAAAVEQLRIWGERTGAEVIARDTGADAAGLAFDAMKEATEKGVDVLLIDTAGRLQNKAELMEELKKVIRVIKKHDPDAPHDVLLTLDATTGQNALNQVEIFGNVAGVTGLVMTKLDGTARGGILVAIAAKYGLPVHFIGVGEGVGDLEPFSAKDFANAIAGLA